MSIKPSRVPNFHLLREKLKLIISEIRYFRECKYAGVAKDNKIGIIVDGVDNRGVREFSRFYSIYDINFYFNRLERRLSR